eukprot:TRINITY_DN12978_c0_g1_i1.p1 TRINITY_DN12978_c0_g1~~TRINITY_DN12978_c0_g1_i1.p1  ORF type:complete len:639 (-),score=162.91 TRINITY_DN12978_c0_g1_i1:191-1888(-)
MTLNRHKQKLEREEQILQDRESNLKRMKSKLDEMEKSVQGANSRGTHPTTLGQHQDELIASLRKQIEDLIAEKHAMTVAHNNAMYESAQEIDRLKKELSFTKKQQSQEQQQNVRATQSNDSKEIEDMRNTIRMKEDEILRLQQLIRQLEQKLLQMTLSIPPPMQTEQKKHVIVDENHPKSHRIIIPRREESDDAHKHVTLSPDLVDSAESVATANPSPTTNPTYERAKKQAEQRITKAPKKETAPPLTVKIDDFFQLMNEEQRHMTAFAGELKQQKQALRQRIAELEEARKAWKVDMATLKQEKDAADYQERYEFLMEVREVLQQQSRDLNRESDMFNKAEKYLHLNKEKIRLIETTFDQKSDETLSSTTIEPQKLTPYAFDALYQKISNIEAELANVASQIRLSGHEKENIRSVNTADHIYGSGNYHYPQKSKQKQFPKHRQTYANPQTDVLQQRWQGILSQQRKQSHVVDGKTEDFHKALVRWAQEHAQVKEQLGAHSNWLQSLRDQISLANFVSRTTRERPPSSSRRRGETLASDDNPVVVEVDPHKELNLIFKAKKKPAWS